MIKIGITGGIGSGKSTVCKIFEALKIPIYNADIAAAKLTNTNKELQKALISLFGNNIYDDFGFLNRKKLAKIIFNDKEALAKVNSLIHPAVQVDYLEWLIVNKFLCINVLNIFIKRLKRSAMAELCIV